MSRTLLQQAVAELLACPRCDEQLDLDSRAASLRCAGCARAYPVQEGIPVFLDAAPEGQEQELAFRNALAQASQARGAEELWDVVAAHHSAEVMAGRARAFRARFAPQEWLLYLGVGYGWCWAGQPAGARVIGLDMSLGNLRMARKLLGPEQDHVLLICADAARLPIRAGAVTGVWSVQTLQHLPIQTLRRAQAELDRVLSERFLIHLANLNPARLHRLLYRLAGRRLHRRGRAEAMELSRFSLEEWIDLWRAFRGGRVRICGGYSELFFHPDLRLRCRPYPLTVEAVLARRAPWLAAWIARQVEVTIESPVEAVSLT